jgi:hypothetical protein
MMDNWGKRLTQRGEILLGGLAWGFGGKDRKGILYLTEDPLQIADPLQGHLNLLFPETLGSSVYQGLEKIPGR